MNIFYSQIDPAVQLELDARGLSGYRRNTQDLNFMLGKIANVQLTAYKSGSADPSYEIATLGGQSVRSGRYLPSGKDGFLTNPTYKVTEIAYDNKGNAYASGSELTDTSRRIGPIITGVSIDIGDHSMGLLNKATVNVTIPNPTRDLDPFEEIWFYPGRYVKIDIEYPNSAVITGADSNLISTASLFGSLPEDVINNKLLKMYPSLITGLSEFKQEIRKLNKFKFQGLITSFDFSYTEDGSVQSTISLTGTSNTYTDVSMLMNPDTKKTEKKAGPDYNTIAPQPVGPVTQENSKQPNGSTEFYGLLYNEFEKLRLKFNVDYNVGAGIPFAADPEILIPFTIDNTATPATDQFILYGQMYPNIQQPKYTRPPFTVNTGSGALTPEAQQAQFEQQQQDAENTFNSKFVSYTETQRYITLGALIQFINEKIIKSKLEGSAEKAQIICNDSQHFSNYYPALVSAFPKDILLLSNNETLNESVNGGMNVYGIQTMYPNVIKNMANYSVKPNWQGVASTDVNDRKMYPSRIFINLEYIQQTLNALSSSNTRAFTLSNFLANISARIAAATGNAIVLKLVTDPSDPTILYFSDTKYLKPIDPKKPVIPYSVPMLANHPSGSIVREFSFQAKLPDNVKNLSYVLNSGTDVSDEEIAPYLNFMYNAKNPDAINAAKAKYKEKHEQIFKNLIDAKTSYGEKPFTPESSTKLSKALIEYIKYPFGDITKTQQMTAPIFPFDAEFKIDGINGLRYGDVVTFAGLPAKYKTNTVFSIIGMTHDVSTEGEWVTNVKCIMRPQIG